MVVLQKLKMMMLGPGGKLSSRVLSHGACSPSPSRRLVAAAARKESEGESEEGERRVVTNAPLSLKQQLRQVERIKGIDKARALKPLPRTKFRRRKKTKEEEAEGKEAITEEPLAKLHTCIRPKKLDQKQLFIVDAYNVCGC